MTWTKKQPGSNGQTAETDNEKDGSSGQTDRQTEEKEEEEG